MATTLGSGLREGSAQKRADILAAARELFMTDGFERTSMDTIASHATVSKRTVYDYYGDKRALLLAVVEQAVSALASAVQTAIDESLIDVSDDLEAALIAFARGITASAIGSSDYAALMRLVSMESANLPELRSHWPVREPEDTLAERLADFGARRLLDVPDPRLAADHFVALTLSSSANSLGHAISPDDTDTQRMIIEGVRVFLRAYGVHNGQRTA